MISKDRLEIPKDFYSTAAPQDFTELQKLSMCQCSQIISEAQRIQRNLPDVIVKDIGNLHGRIGILGGSFDPVQLGHLESALMAKRILNLQTIVFLPTPQNPFKDKPLFDSSERVEILKRTVRCFEGLYVSDFEIIDVVNRRNGVIRTIDSVERLLNCLQPDASLVLLFGVDLLFTLHKWERYHDLFRYAEIAPLGRKVSDNNTIIDALSCGFTEQEKRSLITNFVPVDLEATCFSALSSTIVREKIKRGESVRNYIEPDAYRFLMERLNLD